MAKWKFGIGAGVDKNDGNEVSENFPGVGISRESSGLSLNNKKDNGYSLLLKHACMH